MGRKLTWLHLSDLHLRAGDPYDQTVVLASLLSDIAKVVDSKKLRVDMVFLTGDLAFSGRSDEYAIVHEFLLRLSTAANVPLERLFCVPGNHDVDRSRITHFLGNAARSLTSRDLVSQLIGSPKEISLFTDRHLPYYEFLKSTFPWAVALQHSDLSYTENLEINGTRVAVIGLNSAWAAGSDSDKGAILLGERQVREALGKVKAPDLVIALMHHPFSYLTDFDAHDVQGLLNARCDFLLHGHLHALGVVNVASPDSEVFHLAAGATYQGRSELLSYNILEADLAAGRFQVFIRRYADQGGGFWAADTSMYRAAPDGVIDVKLPERLTRQPQEPNMAAARDQITALMAKTATPDAKPKPEPEPTVPQLPQSLVTAIQDGRCILFAGAGASIDAKLPSWTELLRDLVERVRESGTVSEAQQGELAGLLQRGDYLVLADFCRDQLGKFEFAQFLKERLSDLNRVSRTHRILAKIPFRAAITTNFDSFLENSRHRVQVVLPEMMEKLGAPGVDSLLEDRSALPIIKMHGSAHDVDSIVLTRGDFRRTLFMRPKYREFLRRLFSDSTIFFYGYSFRDTNVDFVLQELTSLYEGMARPHYALLPDPGEIARRYWLKDMNIRIIPYKLWNGSHLPATTFLQSLADKFTGDVGGRDAKGSA